MSLDGWGSNSLASAYVLSVGWLFFVGPAMASEQIS